MEDGPFPRDDGWHFLYRFFNRLAPPQTGLRRLLCGYFWPKSLELSGGGRIYRTLGVWHFGRVIPTGGAVVRRITGSRMAPYTLKGTSIGAARDFYYRSCAFEVAHTPFFLALLAITGYQLVVGRLDLAAQDMLVNLGVNIYPIMHHRHTRVRIVRLLGIAQQRKEG
jgi:hypothetical protein